MCIRGLFCFLFLIKANCIICPKWEGFKRSIEHFYSESNKEKNTWAGLLSRSALYTHMENSKTVESENNIA